MTNAGTGYILGLNCYDHDVSACLLKDGAIRFAINKERVTRRKHDTGFFREVVDYVLEAEGITLDDVGLVVRNCYMLPVAALEERLVHHNQPSHLQPQERASALAHPWFLGKPDHVVDISHHLAHAYSAFAASGFDDGVVMVVDGVGSYRDDVTEEVPAASEAAPLARESESYYEFAGRELKCLHKVWMGPCKGVLSDEFYTMPGLGAVYSRVSTYIFGDWNKCGEVMGLAPYGKPGGEPLMGVKDGELQVAAWDRTRRHPFVQESDADWEKSAHRQEWNDLAWRVQEDAERVLLARARWLHAKTGAKNLCIAGGVALNCVANGKIVEQTPFENVYIQPAAGDDGIAIGCALYGHLALRDGKRDFVMKHAYLGRSYDEFDEAEAFRPLSVRAATMRRKPDDVIAETARILAGGAVIGWFQGRSEYGPRALGNRSILADPRDPGMKDRVNARVKHRQGFRPFAPVVLAERAHEIFEGAVESPFMLLVKRVLPEMRGKLPAITHIDGTARVQTVTAEQNPRLHALLTAFYERTGLPVLLNTSFNLRGEPIVEHPIDAVECFLRTQLDALVLHDWVVEKRYLHKALFPVFRRLARARAVASRKSALRRFAQIFVD